MPGGKRKVALIGPVLPFRGGIAQYTTSLHEALSEQAYVTTISFKRMYPQWLYPGESDKDPNAKPIDGVQYTIDVYNPVTWRKATSEVVKSGCKLAVFDWWTLFWQPGFAYMARRLRKKGIKTAFLCHNLFDHDAQGFKRKLSQKMLTQADTFIVQSAEQRAMLQELESDAEVILQAHPVYDRFPSPTNREEPRGRLDLLFFGLIRPYKGLPVLIEALKKLNDKEIHLSVVGEAWGKPEELKAELQKSGIPNLDLRLEYVSDEEAANYVARADAIVLPYRSATGSGVVSLAYHYAKPVIATAVGGMKDAVIDGETGWLVPPEDSSALADKIKSISRRDCEKLQPAIKSYCKEHSWQNLAKSIIELAS